MITNRRVGRLIALLDHPAVNLQEYFSISDQFEPAIHGSKGPRKRAGERPRLRCPHFNTYTASRIP